MATASLARAHCLYYLNIGSMVQKHAAVVAGAVIACRREFHAHRVRGIHKLDAPRAKFKHPMDQRSGSRRPAILLTVNQWWSWPARLAQALVHHGCDVDLLCPAGHPAESIPGIRLVLRYDSGSTERRLRCALSAREHDLVIPCGDLPWLQLQRIGRRDARHAGLVRRSLGAEAARDILVSRHATLELARELGIRVPRSKLARSEADLRDWPEPPTAPCVLKADYSNGGAGVAITHGFEASLAAWRRLRAKPRLARALAQRYLSRVPLALWGRAQLGGQNVPVTLQDFVHGDPANALFYCREGQVLGSIAVIAASTAGATGPATIVRPYDDAEMIEAGRALIQRLGLSGFVGLDFMIEDVTRLPYLIEVNPRCTPIGHIALPLTGSLAGRVAADLGASPPATPWPAATQASIALIGGLRPDQDPPADAHLDLPDDPALAHTLTLPPRPQRSRLHRMFKTFLRL